MPCLRPTCGPQSVQQIELSDRPLRVGRSTSVDLCLNDQWVSRYHCEFRREQDGVVVRDLQSTHGTYVNDRRITVCKLDDGDVISIGLNRFVVDLDGNAQDQTDSVHGLRRETAGELAC